MEKQIPMKRVNTRVTAEQQAYIKRLAKRLRKTEGEIIREMVDYYMNRPK